MLTIAELTKSPDLATQHHAELTAPGRPHQRYSLPNSKSPCHPTKTELTKSPDLATQHHAELTAPGRPHQRYSLPNSTSSMHAHDSGTYQVSRACNAASCRADGSRQAAPTLQSAQQHILNACSR